MTHTQNALSFEVALKDGLLCMDEGKKSVLVGAADEAIPFLERLRGNLIETDHPFTSGATFLVLSDEKGNAISHIQACDVSFSKEDIETQVARFLSSNNCTLQDLDLVLEAKSVFASKAKKHISFPDYSGYYQSASAFALHMANDWLIVNKEARTILIVNNLESNKLGLTLIRRNEVEA